MSDQFVTAVEYVEMIDELEKEAADLLPGDPSKCFYDHGYVRQHIYSCITCRKGDEFVGVCYGCFISCHTDHLVHELFERRNFRCDCGTIESSDCQLSHEQRSKNIGNKYNRNFEGMFCYCNIQYDPYQEQDSMFQCIGCEDWFHQACIGIKDNDFEEYICSACFEKFDFLACYVGTNGYIGRLPLEINKSCSKPTKIELESTLDRKGIFCLLDWRESLCKCLNCIEIYNSMDAAFVEKETTLEFAIDECQGANTVDLGMKALEQMDRVKAIQSIEHYNDMKNDLMKYLKSFSSIVSLMKQTIKW